MNNSVFLLYCFPQIQTSEQRPVECWDKGCVYTEQTGNDSGGDETGNGGDVS